MKLKDIADYVTEKISSDAIDLDSYITTDSLLQNKGGRDKAVNMPPQSCMLTRFKVGDVLVANIRPYLKKVWKADIDGGCNADVLVFRAKSNHSANFLYAVLLQDAFYAYAMKGAKGSKMPRGDKDQIMRYEIPMLSSTEESIGKFIVDINAKIALNREINRNLEAMARQLYDYWFVQFDFPDENGRPYKSSGGKMVWNEKLKREIPEGWKALEIGEILDKYPSTKRFDTSEYLTVGQYPIIDQGESYIVGFTNEEENILFKTPAVVFGDHSTRVKFVATPFGRGADGTQILYSNHPCISIWYLYCAVVALEIPNPGYSRHFKYLKGLPIIAPDSETAKKFSDILNPIFDKWNKIIFENIDLQTQRDELLPLLMNGQVSVTSSEVNCDLSHD
ncbi:MAG: restriction endonuclease subunit S [Bacteroidales bacterium]|nr:restriction endonuclease subunit S [Bacteroidales bacterium]